MMAWDNCFYMVEAFMSLGIGSDFLSTGILPADKKTKVWERIKNVFNGGVFLAGGIYFYFKIFACAHLVFISVIAAFSVIPGYICWKNKLGGSSYEKLSRSGGLILFLVVIVGCFAIFLIRFLRCETAKGL